MNDQQARLMAQRVEHHRAKGFQSPEELLRFCEVFWDIKIPRQRVCPDQNCLAEYITAAWFEDSMNCVCWANRGGGKTMAGALVTWLESVFKAGCETKVLGGSGEQSLRMYNHIRKFNSEAFRHLARGEALKTYTELLNGFNIRILTASTKSVRGLHPQKLRLDEIDEFDDKIYEAALLIPLSSGGIEASTHIYSTMHKSYGLMNQVIDGAAESGYRIFKWCVLDVLQKCVDRDCDDCGLWEDGGGKAKQASGFYRIDDAIGHKRQVSRETWESEMLCYRPSQAGLIYKEFDLALHVV